MVIPVANRGPRKVAYSSFDLKSVPNVSASPGIQPEHLVVVSQLNDLEALLRAQIAAISAGDEVALERAQRIAAVAALRSELETHVNNLILQGIHQKIAVGARVTSLPTDIVSIPGFLPGADSPAGRLLVDSDNSTSGIYIAVGGSLTRDPAFMAADDFNPGLMIWVDSNDAVDRNTFWVLEDSPSVAGGGISASFEPFGRMQDIIAALGSAIAFNGNQVTWNFDADYLAVINGNATLSAAFRARIDSIQDTSTQAANGVITLQGVTETLTSRVNTLLQQNQDQELAIQSHEASIATLSAQAITTNSNVSNLAGRATQLESSTASLGLRTTSLEVALPSKASIETVEAIATRVTNTESAVATKASVATVTAVSNRVDGVESELVAKASKADVYRIGVHKLLDGGVASRYEDGGQVRTQTKFTVTFPEPGYTYLTSVVADSSKAVIESPLVAHPGNTCTIYAYTDLTPEGQLNPVEDNKIISVFIKTRSWVEAFGAPNAAPIFLPSVVTGSGSDQFILTIYGDPWANGDGTSDAAGSPKFSVSIDGVALGEFIATASGLQRQQFIFNGNFGAGAHEIQVVMTNDAYEEGVGDRNLYIDSVIWLGANLNYQQEIRRRTDIASIAVTGGTPA